MERVTFEFRAEFFNAFNSAQFANPDTTFSDRLASVRQDHDHVCSAWRRATRIEIEFLRMLWPQEWAVRFFCNTSRVSFSSVGSAKYNESRPHRLGEIPPSEFTDCRPGLILWP